MRLFLGIIFLFAFTFVKAQSNQVLNPSFEQYSQCPYGPDQVNFAYHWSGIDSLGDPTCTPEYCRCDSTTPFSVPTGGNYYQYPRTGSGMVQVFMYYDEAVSIPYNRDYLMGRLISPLLAGETYCVSFYVCSHDITGYFVDKIGAYLDSGAICSVGNCGYPQSQFTPQVENMSGVIADTFSWVKIEGTFTANGTERFVTIGNFYSKANTNVVQSNINLGGAYYLIDDVSVIPSDLPAYAGGDTWVAEGDSVFLGRTPEIGLECYWYVNGNVVDSGAGIWAKPDTTTTYVVQQTLCGVVRTDTVTVSVFPVSINGITNSRQLSVYPNPAGSVVNVMQERVVFTEAVIVNNVGQQVGSFHLAENNSVLDISALPAGVYYLQLRGERGREVRSFVKAP